MTGAGSITLHLLVLCVLAIWMAKRTVRASRPLAISLLFVWPLSIIALVRHWKHPGADIRLPFLLALLTAGGLALKLQDAAVGAQAGIDASRTSYSERELRAMTRDHPELVADVRAARREAARKAESANEAPVFYEDLFDGDADDQRAEDKLYLIDGELSRHGVEDVSSRGGATVVGGEDDALPANHRRRRPDAASTGVSAGGGDTPDFDDADLAAVDPDRRWSTRAPLSPRKVRLRQDEASLRSAARQLSYRFGSVPLVAAHAALRLPRGFRFVPGYSLPAMARAVGRPFDRHTTLGWVVHDSVDIAAADAWYVEVEFLKTGLLRAPRRLDVLLPGLAGDPLADGSGHRFGSELLAPAWLADAGVATWGVMKHGAADRRAEILAVLPLRHGALVFVMHDVPPERYELGLRTTRLLALQTDVEPLGQVTQFDPKRDRLASKDLLAWMRGESLAAPGGRG